MSRTNKPRKVIAVTATTVMPEPTSTERALFISTAFGGGSSSGGGLARVFGSHPPAATMVVVAGLIDTRMRVELEVEATS